MRRIAIRPLLLLAVLLSPPGHALAAPGDKRTLVLRGRVTDAKGWPVAGARVLAEGARRLKTTTDDAGQYVLNLALGSGAELARQPVSLRVHAERRGWRFALPSGEVETGLDLRVVAGADGVARCEVRANQTAVGGAAVRAFTTDGDATAVANVNFLGVEGEEIGSPPPLDLPLVQTVTLAGVHVARPPPVAASRPPAPRAAEAPAPERTGGGRTGTMVESPAPEKAHAREPAKSGPAAGKPAPDTTRAIATTKPGSPQAKGPAKPAPEVAKPDRRAQAPPPEKPAAREAAKPKGPTEEEKALARAEAKRLRGAARERDRLARREREGQKAREKEEARARRVAALSPKRDTVAVRPPRELPAPPPDPVSPVLGTTPSDPSPVKPKPDSEPRLRSAPLVIRAPSPARPAPGDSCTCRLEGTIEVDWDKPLPARTRVVVSLNWYPTIADTVELFMGSPRGFALPVVPCGPQRLRLVNLGSIKFDVASREAMAGFRCESGTLRQFRIVLRPR